MGDVYKRQVRTGLKVEERFKGDDIVDTVTLTRRYVDFSYVDGNEYVFMDKDCLLYTSQ